MSRPVWRLMAGEASEIFAALKGGPWALWAAELRRVRSAFAEIDRAASESIAGTTGAVAQGTMLMPMSLLRPGRVVHTPLTGVDGTRCGVIFSAHPDVVTPTGQFARRGRVAPDVEVARRLHIPANRELITWADAPYSNNPWWVFYHRADNHVFLPVVGTDGDVVYSVVHPAVFGRHLGTWFKSAVHRRPIVLCPYPSRFTGAANEAGDIVAGMRQAGMRGPTDVYAARAGVVPNIVPAGIPDMDYESWLTLVAKNSDHVLGQPFDRHYLR